MRRDPRPAGAVLSAGPVMRPASYDELNELCRGIRKSVVHLETRDAYGTEVEVPHLAKWRRGEPDDLAWLSWWLEMLRGHRAAGRTCRRARIVFFFQAEDGIRDLTVTGVQTCALPI